MQANFNSPEKKPDRPLLKPLAYSIVCQSISEEGI
jgi:hypothetical protein